MRLEGSLSIEILISDELYVHRNQLDQFFLDEISWKLLRFTVHGKSNICLVDCIELSIDEFLFLFSIRVVFYISVRFELVKKLQW